ncbi:MAG: tetratricopeptide repeat protein [Candidatus Schekmanbacteria bacterium]|nr:tetratricopeptide repeat protein [Candidatus Schekmanbacteria bacterium]
MLTGGKGLSATYEDKALEALEVYLTRFKQDSDSIVFFPLAKAYLKAGETAQAIEVCREGLVKHPYYWGARVVLAKAYLKLNKISEAKEELEKVNKIVPNNVLAAKMLAQIYLREGELYKAVLCYRTISAFYPEQKEFTRQIKFILEVEVPRKKKQIQVLEEYREVIRNLYRRRR